MSKLALDLILDQYRAQRKYRQAKRNQYLRRFQVLKQNFSHIHQHYPSHINSSHPHPHHQHTQPRVQAVVVVPTQHSHVEERVHEHRHQSHHNQHRHDSHHHHEHVERPNISKEKQQNGHLQAEEALLLKENQQLKKNLVSIQTEERDRLQAFKGQIEAVRNKYIQEIKKLTQTAKGSKQQIEAKMHKIKLQSEAAQQKNVEIDQTNKVLKKQIQQGNALMGQYATEIKKQYGQKIGQFEKIFNSSNEKIEAMEKEFNEDEFIENTLKNEELLKSIEQNASKAEEAGKILQDYGALLQGKKQILVQISSNIEMKEKEIEKMIELQGKMKTIMDKLTAEKKIYVAENGKMAEELMEIKNLLVGVMNESK